MDLKLRKIVGWFSVFIFLGAFLFVGLAQAASPTTTIAVGGSPSGLAVTPDGKYVYVPNGEDVAVIDTASSKVVARVAVGGWPFSGLAVSHSGEYVYVLNRGLNGEGFVSVISVDTNTVISTIMQGIMPSEVIVSPDGKYVYVLSSEHLEIEELLFSSFGVVSVISTATHAVLSNISTGRYAYAGLAVSPDGAYFYVSGVTGLLHVVDSSLEAEIASIKLGEKVSLGRVVVSFDGKYVYVLGNEAVFVVSTKSNTVVATVSDLGYPSDLALSPDGKYVYVTEAGRDVVSAINTSTYCVDFSVDAGRSPRVVVVSPDGGCLYVSNSYTGSSDGKVSFVKLDSSVGSSGIGGNLSVVWWLLVVGGCVIVVAVIVFIVVMRIKRKPKQPVSVNSDVESTNLTAFCLIPQYSPFV